MKGERADVTGVFLSSETTWGRPKTADWRHFAVHPPAAMVFAWATRTPRQAMAEKREDGKAALTALDEFTPQVPAQALKLLDTDSFAM